MTIRTSNNFKTLVNSILETGSSLLWYPPATENRVVFDIGSGGTKSAMVKVNLKTNKVVEVLKEVDLPYSYQKFISNSEDKATLEEPHQLKGLEIMKKIEKIYGVDFKQTKTAGIATAWARNAKNSVEYLDLLKKNNIHIKIASQEEEGQLGYKAVLADVTQKNINQDNILVWDIGGGSFQLNIKDGMNIHVYNGPYGAANFDSDIRSYIDKQIGFFTKAEVTLAKAWATEHVSKSISQDPVLASKLSTSAIQVYGIGQFINKGVKTLIHNQDYITRSDVDVIIDSFTEMSIEKAVQAYNIEPQFIGQMQNNMILFGSIMDALHADNINFHCARSTDVVAVDQEIWSHIPKVETTSIDTENSLTTYVLNMFSFADLG